MGISNPLLTWTTSIKKVRWLIVPPFFQSDNDEITNSFLLSKALIKRIGPVRISEMTPCVLSVLLVLAVVQVYFTLFIQQLKNESPQIQIS